jgi:Integrase core domain
MYRSAAPLSAADEEWMQQIARATQETWGYLSPCRYVLHDRDTKFCASFRSVLRTGGVRPIRLPARSPNLNAFAERWVRSVKQECLSKLVLFGAGPLSRVLAEFSAHYHSERNHQGKGKVISNVTNGALPALDFPPNAIHLAPRSNILQTNNYQLES